MLDDTVHPLLQTGQSVWLTIELIAYRSVQLLGEVGVTTVKYSPSVSVPSCPRNVVSDQRPAQNLIVCLLSSGADTFSGRFFFCFSSMPCLRARNVNIASIYSGRIFPWIFLR